MSEVELFRFADQSVTAASFQPQPLIVGTEGDDILRGDATDNEIQGLGGNDQLSGLGGDDTLEGGAGNDTISGGSGDDTVLYSGNRGDYAITLDASTRIYTVVDERDGSPDGTDTVAEVEFFAFADGTVATADLISGSNQAPTDILVVGSDVDENSAAGTVVATLAAVDADVGDTATFSLVAGATGLFALNGSQIVVAAGASIDFETTRSYDLTVRATDSAGAAFDKTITVTVNDVNEAPTDAALSGNSVAENSANGTAVGIVTGVDPDAGSVLSYALTNDAGGRFAIDAASGQITVANGGLLDFESAASHSVTVRVTDRGGLSVDKTFSIAVTNVNEAPTDATLSGGSVAENSANGTAVGIVTGVDPDAGSVLSYALTNNAGGRFAIDATSGQITVANGGLLDFETATSHSVTVRVTDQGGLSVDKAFSIAVTNVNEAPTDATLIGRLAWRRTPPAASCVGIGARVSIPTPARSSATH